MKRFSTLMSAMSAVLVLAASASPDLNAAPYRLDPSRLPAPLTSPAALAPPPAVPGKTPSATQPLSSSRTGGLPGKKPAGRTTQVTPEARAADVRGRLDVRNAAGRAGLAGRADLGMLKSVRAVEDLEALASSAGSSLRIVWHPETETPRFLAGGDLSGNDARAYGSGDPASSAQRFLNANSALLRISDPDGEMVMRTVERDRHGFTAVRFDRTVHGIPVWGEDVVVRFDRAGRPIGFSGYYSATEDVPAASPLVLPEAAVRNAVRALRETAGVDASITGSQLVYYPVNGTLRLAWHHTATAGMAWRGDLFLDAATGAYLHHIKTIHNDGPAAGSGLDLSNTNRVLNLYNIGSNFFMINTTKPMFNAAQSQFPNKPVGTINVLNAQNGDGSSLFHTTSTNANSWTNHRNAVSAAFFAGRVYDYYSATHARNSIDGKGGSMLLVVNFQQNFDNAFWNGQFMVFGNGNGTNFSDLAGSLDVTAHEMSHGVIEHTANLIYEFEPGALNEHFADAFGASCDFFVQGPAANWLLGEDVTTPAIPGDALRDMENPDGPKVAFGGQQPAHMSQFQVLTKDQDNGGVHINSGIPNKAFFLAATAIGIAKAEQIWYRALSQHLTRNSKFVDFRLATIQAAGELYGATEQAAVTSAMNAVGITGGNATPPPPPPQDNTGSDFIAVVDTESDGHIYRVPPDFSANFQDISGLPAGPGGRPSFSDDGSVYAFVASDENIYLGDYTNRVQLSDTGGWWSVALSADGRYLAGTTIAEDGRIFLFDLGQQGNDVVYNLTSQNSTSGQVPDVVVFADVLEFPVEPGFLIYDALNKTTVSGATYEYWEINLLRLEDGKPFRVFPPLPQGESVGNPTFAQNSDNRIAFDYAAADGNIYGIGFDFQTGAEGIITNNLQSISRPTFSGDDSDIYYMYSDNTGDTIFRVSLAADGVTGLNDDAIWATGGVAPVWMTVGDRPVPVHLTSLEGSWTPDRVALRWRVADAEAFSGYLIARSLESEGEAFERRTERPITMTSGDADMFAFEEAPPLSEVARYRIDGVTRSGDVIELGRLVLTPAGAPPARPMLVATPNPFRNGARIVYRLPEVSGPPRITIHDVTGRLVTELSPADVLANEGYADWSGYDATGRRVRAGEYFVKMTAGGTVATTRVVRVP